MNGSQREGALAHSKDGIHSVSTGLRARAEPSCESSDHVPRVTDVREALASTVRELASCRSMLERAELCYQTIQTINSRMLSQIDVVGLAKSLLKDLCPLVGADNGNVMLLDDTKQAFDIVADVGLPTEVPRHAIPVTSSVGAVAMNVREPIVLRCVVDDQDPERRQAGSSLMLPITERSMAAGVVNLHRVRAGPHFDEADRDRAAIVVATFSAMFGLLKSHGRFRRLSLSAIRALILTIEAKDPYTRGHCERVGGYAYRVAQAVGLGSTLADEIEVAALLHDVGKIAVPEAVLVKAGPLTVEEFESIKRHPRTGVDILGPFDLPKATVDGVHYHHERLDGRGYPTGLAGDAIPLSARIIAVVDAFDAMTFARPYRSARSSTDAFAELRRCANTQFDGAIVEAFIRVHAERSVVAHQTHSGGHRDAHAEVSGKEEQAA
jgi:putative nucleotidyltransferase with HDIG domain